MIDDPGFDGDTPRPPRRPRPPRYWPIAAAILVVLLLAVAWWLWWRPAPPPPTPVPVATPAAPAPEPTAEELPAEEPLPTLDASDELVRELAAELSSHPRLIAWLANDELLRRFTVATANVAEGVNPRRHLTFLEPRGEFSAVPRGDRIVVNPASYERFETAVQVFESLDSQGLAEAYRRLEPLVEQAYLDLGYPEGGFRTTLLAAFRRLLAVPRPQGDVVLERGVESYRYADPELEGLSGAGKQLLRMGPRNVARVQAKLVEIGLALGFTPEELRG
ncbi:MAG: DUF3014 domain-containing protein [Thermoanaerobaculia bacterium]|nr:DUF3014 domain-containing protein [Thermoanaerobaculia bacterium]